MINARRILTDEDAAEFVDGGIDRAGNDLEHRFTPAEDPRVGLDFKTEPARPDVAGLDLVVFMMATPVCGNQSADVIYIFDTSQ